MKVHLREHMRVIGPGIAVAATGVGAGDMITATVAGSQFGTHILWAALYGAVLKYVLNEGVSRWQLATDTTLLEGWAQHLGRGIAVFFTVYLVLWAFIVAGALISACGLAGHALFGGLSVAGWGILHSLVAAALVLAGRYILFERVMKFFIALMFVVILWCAVLLRPDWLSLLQSSVIPEVPPGGGKFILGVLGGVGGSVTLLSYGYWIREKGWTGVKHLSSTRMDLGVAYLLTGIFGMAVMIIAAGVDPARASGSNLVMEVADRLGELIGPAGRWIFIFGFWGAVFSSMLGVWQGVPYLFSDFVIAVKRWNGEVTVHKTGPDSPYYRGFLIYLALPPMLLLIFERPVWIIIIYALVGALFMPFLAGTILYLNNQTRWVGELKNGRLINTVLIVSLLLFGYLGITGLRDAF